MRPASPSDFQFECEYSQRRADFDGNGDKTDDDDDDDDESLSCKHGARMTSAKHIQQQIRLHAKNDVISWQLLSKLLPLIITHYQSFAYEYVL